MHKIFYALKRGIIIPLAAFCLSCCGGSSPTDDTVHVTGISLDRSSLTLNIGDTHILHQTVTPELASDKSVIWSSDNSAVATVSGGTVSAVSEGSALIIVTTVEGGKTASCKVLVESPFVAVSSITLDKESVEMTEGERLSLVADVTPSDATDKSLKWSSSDESVAGVEDGSVSAIKPGNAVITVTSFDGKVSATCSVTIKAKVVPVEGVQISEESITLKKGQTMTLSAEVMPSNATNQTLFWSASNSSVVSVENGLIKALSAGSAVVTVTTEDGEKTSSCKVTVLPSDDDTVGEIPPVNFD